MHPVLPGRVVAALTASDCVASVRLSREHSTCARSRIDWPSQSSEARARVRHAASVRGVATGRDEVGRYRLGIDIGATFAEIHLRDELIEEELFG
jgi:hypothetical protein